MRPLDRETDPFVLLRIKFRRPRLRDDLVPRPRLLDQLRACLSPSDSPEAFDVAPKLILVSAPAGYGKTIALGQWIDACPYPSAWLFLDRGDSDLTVFLTYLTAAVQAIYPNACPQTSSLLRTQN